MREVENTDKPLWDSEDGMATVFVTKEGEGIGISHAGWTITMKAKQWIESMDQLDRYQLALSEAQSRISLLEGYITDRAIKDFKK